MSDANCFGSARSLQSRRSRAGTSLAFAGALLAGCVTPTPYQPPKPEVIDAFNAPLPHGGELKQLHAFWSQFDDPMIAKLIGAAEQRSSNLAAALARIEQARANARVAGAALAPIVDGKASLNRNAPGIPPFGFPRTVGTIGPEVAWEIDLFGAARAARGAALTRVDARTADWHDARTLLAAEVGATFLSLRSCEAILAVQLQDNDSLKQTVLLTKRKVDNGLSAPADLALLRASLANSNSQVIAQRAECDVLIKSLTYLTEEPEAGLRASLTPNTSKLPQPKAFVVDSVPAAALTQRPDLASLERELAASVAEIDSARADQFPRLTLTGNIGRAGIRFGGDNFYATSWGFGPALSLPLFDAGRRSARVDAFRARFDELRAQYMARAKLAVREVEEALVRLDAATRRQNDAESAVRDFEVYLNAAQTRWRVGTGNLIELEEARRQALNANGALIQIRRERVAQWINLYKALGGGWQPGKPATTAGMKEQ